MKVKLCYNVTDTVRGDSLPLHLPLLWPRGAPTGQSLIPTASLAVAQVWSLAELDSADITRNLGSCHRFESCLVFP